jgi:hypothetical protein
MRRREFIMLLGGAGVWSLGARAHQPSAKVIRIGFLGLPTADSLPKRPEAFRAGLRDARSSGSQESYYHDPRRLRDSRRCFGIGYRVQPRAA